MSDGNSGYEGVGRYPVTAEGVVDVRVCFDHGGNARCGGHETVGVVHCNGFLLWRLPGSTRPAGNDCNNGYCTTPSGL
eukprot:COSAG05_NODE_249_length_12903_cov_128.635505_2_plen_78_part_00